MTFKSLHAFEHHLEKSGPKLPPIYVIVAKDDFERKSAVETVVHAARKQIKEPAPTRSLQGDGLSQSALFQELDALALFEKLVIIVVTEAEKLPSAILKALAAYLNHPNPAVALVLSFGTAPAPSFLTEVTTCGEVLVLPEEKMWEKEKRLQQWAMGYMQKEGKNLSQERARFIVSAAGIEMGRLKQELDKLLCYIDARITISDEDLQAVCTPEAHETIWRLAEMLLAGRPADAIRIAHQLLEESSIHGLLKQIRGQFQTGYQVCSIVSRGGSSAEVTVLFPYMRGRILEQHINQAQAYGMNRFKQAMIAIHATETLAKNSTIDVNVLVDLLIVKLTTIKKHDT